MPELPEVETVKRTLNELVKGKQIENVTVRLARIIQRPDDTMAFAHMLAGHTIEKVERRGKFLRILLDGLVLVSHLRMEGRYGLHGSDEPLDKHTHVIFHFTDGTELRYTDVRQFGTMHLFQPGEDLSLPPLNKLGDEPLEPSFTPERFREIVSGKSTKIKSLLLNQEYVVGIGNIYVDESLHRAGIHPEDSPKALSREQLDKLHHAIVSTLTEAVNAGGSSVKSYVNGQGESGTYQQQLLIYGRKDQPCAVCGTLIEKSVVGGRGTHYCPSCQRASTVLAR
ncbi:DNA-formamidopyrimidine glycosylase [Paenibacillus sp. NPDC058177]|uniref:DNA-formamidopyrimidine glycosylase n=1 Tax=Paenibacillus sp. NPDC058177 TaxID=3346369 RepID=UPI0036D92971